MKTPSSRIDAGKKTLLVTAITAILVTACASGPVTPDGAAAARSKLVALQSDPNLATLAPVAVEQAELAVRNAERPEADKALAANRVYLADRKVDIARAQAETRYAEDQRATLTAEREKARLDSRTREADVAKAATAVARNDADAANAATADANAATAVAKGE